MFRRTLLSCLLVGAGLVVSCAEPPVGSEMAPAPASDPEDAVRSAVEGLIAADNVEDLDAVMASYADDAVLLPPDGAPVTGKQAIAPRYQSLFRDFDVELEVTIDRMGVSSEWAWCQGATRGRFSPRDEAAGEPRQVSDKYLMVLSPTSDGSWVVQTLMWSPLPSP